MIHQRKMRMEVTENLGVERGVMKKVVAFCGLVRSNAQGRSVRSFQNC